MLDLHVIYLPERDDMLRRLKSVSDDAHVVENFYPLLLEQAGEPKVGTGVVLMYFMAVGHYAYAREAEIDIVTSKAEEFITALLDDEQARDEALGLFRGVRLQVAVTKSQK